ncbi:hypothetical protein DSECCO2_271470 [anaerobic digester metagenome]
MNRMEQTDKYRRTVFRYFADTYKSCVLLIGLILAAFLISFTNPWTNWNLVMPVIAILCPLLYLPMFLFHHNVLADIRNRAISERDVTVVTIQLDRHHNLNSRGRFVGHRKYNLTTTDGETYTFSPASEPELSFKPFSAKIVFCRNTKFILSLKKRTHEMI